MTKNIGKIFFIFGFILLIFTAYNFVIILKYSESKIIRDVHVREQYSEEIAMINSMKEFKNIIKTEIEKKNLSGIEIPILVDDFVRKKFFHGTPYINWNENWFLNFLNLLFPKYYFISLMKPNDIMKVNYAMCSQQSIVFQDIIKDYNFEYASLRLNIPKFPHFTSAVKVNKNWYFFDSNLEPEYDRKDFTIFNNVLSANKSIIEKIYSTTKVIYIQPAPETPTPRQGEVFLVGEFLKKYLTEKDITKDMITLSNINSFPAPRGVLIQNISFLISWYGWLILLLCGFIFSYFIKKNN